MLAILKRLSQQRRRLIDLDLEKIDESALLLEYITDERIMKGKIVTPLLEETQKFNINFFCIKEDIKEDNKDEQLSIF